MGHALDILIRVVLGFVSLLVLTRLIGNKQLGQLNVFTYISGIVIGSMVADAILHQDIRMWRWGLGLVSWGGLVFIVELISQKSIKARELLDGQPIILIKHGKISEEALKKERMNMDDLTMLLRTNMIFSILDVDYAILEPNGDLSVLKKQEKDYATREDLAILPKPQTHIPMSIVVDSRVLEKNLVEAGLSTDWLARTLKQAGIQSKDEILYAELQSDSQLYLQLRNGDRRVIC